MNLLKRIVVAAISGSVLLSSVTLTNTVNTCSTELVFAESLTDSCSLSENLSVTYTETVNSAESTAAVTTAVTVQAQTVTTAVSGTSEAVTTEFVPIQITVAVGGSKAPETITAPAVTEEGFDVFDIYEAYQKYAMATTTAVTDSQSAKQTTITLQGIVASDIGDGVKGIDVSKWQADIDWQKVKADGIEYAIIRAGYGKKVSQEDPMFDTNMINAQKAGVDRGVYWYSYATTVEEAYQEAEACYEVIKGYSFEYPLIFDIEESSQEALSTATVSAIIDAFCSTMQEKGYYVAIYSYTSFLNTKVYDSILEKYDIAVAHYGVASPNYSKPYGIWQYSSTGTVNGISGNVDMDIAYKDYPFIMASRNFNGY